MVGPPPQTETKKDLVCKETSVNHESKDRCITKANKIEQHGKVFQRRRGSF